MDLLFSTLTDFLKIILADFEFGSKHGEVKFLPVWVVADIRRASFINGVNLVTRILDEVWPCRECFGEETILTYLTKLTGSIHCLRLCTHITLTAAISNHSSAGHNGVKALQRLIPILAKAGALEGHFLHEINTALLPTFVYSDRLTVLRLMPIFRLLQQLSAVGEMEQSVKVCLGFSTSLTFSKWTNGEERGKNRRPLFAYNQNEF